MKELYLVVLFSVLLLFAHANAAEYAGSAEIDSRIKDQQKEIRLIDEKLHELTQRAENLRNTQNELSQSISRSYDIQNEINNAASKLQGFMQFQSNISSPIPIKLIQSTNWYLYLLPIVTICIVICGTYLSIRNIDIKSNETLKALENSNATQIEINNKSIHAEHESNRLKAISENRQQWINSLRDEIASLLTVLAKSKLSETSSEILKEQLWIHYYKIKLLINPREDDHNSLVTKIRSVIMKILNGEELGSDLNEVTKLSQDILKREWERVKKFE